MAQHSKNTKKVIHSKMNKTKAKVIAKTLIKNKLNGKATVRELAPTNTSRGDDVKAVRWLKNPDVNQAITQLLDNAGITEEDIGTMIRELTGSKATATFQGKVTQSKTIPNDNVRVKTLQMILDKVYNKDKQTVHNHLHLEQSNPEEIKEAIKEQVKEMKNLGLI